MKDKIKFSIITVCYNEEKKIQLTIESVLGQKWDDFEYIIIDGDSTDTTKEIICKYAEKDSRIKWYSEKDDGIYNAMNKGICRAKGDFLHFLNAGDTFYSSDVLEKVSTNILVADAEIIIGDVVKRREFGTTVSSYKIGKELREDLKNLIKRGNVCHQAIFAIRNSLMEGFDEQFKICADYDWLCRQVNLKRKIVKIDLAVVEFNLQGVTNQAKYQKLGLRESMRIVTNNFPETDVSNYSEIENLLLNEVKARFLFRNMNRWLKLKQCGIDISYFFTSQNIYRIAIYGTHNMGQRLYDELIDSKVNVCYGIDKNRYKLDWDIPIIHPDKSKDMDNIDAIVITPIIDYFEIKEYLLKSVNCPIISLEDVLFYQY